MAAFVNKVVVITAASSGIGAGTAEYLATKGAWLVLVGRNVENLKSVSAKCLPKHGAPEPLQIIADVTVEADAKRIIDETITKFQKIDVLVNNAGILGRGSIETATLEQYDNIMNCNVRSIFHLTQLAVPHLIASKGNIVNVSSVNGMRSFPGVLAYNMSKSSILVVSSVLLIENPALFIRTSRRRYFLFVSLMIRSESTDTSAGIISGSLFNPNDWIFFETFSNFSALRPTKARRAPSFAKYSAHAAPIPELAPVIKTTLFANAIFKRD